ncbi:MAG: type II toxin-antitoxin system RelE/ParE family toxin [Bacteroidetes bacterium]|nr:MAG: type II toxin-antitoxin system RelE/ParE family toxin [Bacteroidota bacterium]
MAKYVLTKKAVQDLAEVWEYTFDKWSEKQADRYYESLISACSEIAENPMVGKKYEDVSPDLFGLLVGRHIIFYRLLATDHIEITRILHQRMDLKKRIEE